MEKTKFKYDAFISYRHCELDKYVAENLHRILETYNLPKNIKKKLGITGKPFERVFRDQEELPLSSNLEDPIIEALKDSKYLIVICSPRLKESLWCKKEIQTFKKLRGRKNIFCILVEGEPNESFPEEVLMDEEVVEKNGKKVKEKILVEPLAADVRGKDKKEVLKKLKEEKLRLVAPMYNLDYDDLKQRHRIRKQQQIIRTAIGIVLFCIAFTIYSLIMFIKINMQQNVLSEYHALSLADKAIEYLSNDNRYDAIKSSYQALTDFDDIMMPYTPEAEYALTESLGVYDAGSTFKAVSQLKTKGVATLVKSSRDNTIAAIYDESDTLTLFKTDTLKVIAKYSVDTSLFDETEFSFIGNDLLAFVNKDRNISIVNIKDGKLVNEIKRDKDLFLAVRGESTGEYLTYITSKQLFIYSIKDNKVIGSLNTNEEYIRDLYYSEDSKYLFAGTSKTNFDITKSDSLVLHVISTSDAKEVNSEKFEAGYIEGIYTKGNDAILLMNNTIGAKHSIVLSSYNFINGSINWSKTFDDKWGKLLIKSYAENTNDLAVVHYDTVTVMNAATGNVIESFNNNSEIIGIFAYTNTNTYLVFAKSGQVSYINMDAKSNVEYKGKYEFNVNEYSKVALTEKGYLLIPFNDNRVILYEAKSNKDIKEEEIEIKETKSDSIKTTEYDELKKSYDVKNKSLVNKMLYDDKKELLFVSYTNEDLAIYQVKDKKHLKTLSKVGEIDTYYGKDKYGRIYVGDISDSYIIDSNYNKVGHIKGLCKIDKDRIYVSSNSKIYSMKIYNLDEIKAEAKNYLK